MWKARRCPQAEPIPGGNGARPGIEGSSVFPPDAWAELAVHLGLSGRELQIVRGTFDDRSEFQMAVELGVSPSTIHTHVERLHHKLTVASRVQLVVRVMREFVDLTATPGS
jgi:DNA-binding CsgD family transcriptional regulator